MFEINTNYQHNYNITGTLKSNPVHNTQSANVPFGSNTTAAGFASAGIGTYKTPQTELRTKEEKEKYNYLTANLDKSGKKELHKLLKNGTLLRNDSNDKTSVLDNLYKILTTPRWEGLDNSIILKETVNTITNPYLITQQFGDIPQAYQEDALKLYAENNPEFNPLTTSFIKKSIAQSAINLEHSGTCVAASIEFNLAQKNPAEFVRFAERLTSPDMAVKKEIRLDNLADNVLDAVWLLNAFEVPYEAKDFNKAILTFAPDKNAVFRAKIQNSNRDEGERSVIDVLMQSTLMQVGSQQTYDTLTDTRKGKFNQSDKGLIEFEKTFTESVVEDKNKISVTYQTVDENARITGYETDFNTMKKQIISALSLGENVIIGYTLTDAANKIINGHEITITGVKQDSSGKLVFICNDTDDNHTGAIMYSEDYLLPKIHHAALPQVVVADEVNIVENWVEGLKSYKQLKQQSYNMAA